MARTAEYIIHGPPVIDDLGAHAVHKSLPIRRESKRVPTDLRELYRTSADINDESALEQLKSLPHGVPTTPNLPPTPPTPPAANGDSTQNVPLVLEPSPDTALYRSTPVTPINQQSPPTPDNTPPAELKRAVPRPFLGTQPSLASTHAESFKTAREEITSDDESVYFSQAPQTPRARNFPSRNLNGIYPSIEKMAPSASPIPSRLKLATPLGAVDSEGDPFVESPATTAKPVQPSGHSETKDATARPPRAYTPSPARDAAPMNQTSEKARQSPPSAAPNDLSVEKVRRGPSLRDRLRAAEKNSASASTEKFASIVGWTSAVSQEQNTDKRHSGASTTSTIGALVLETTPLPRKRTTLRKVTKHDSLRSASSPLPASQTTSVDSPHRLIHKKARLSNENRWSFESEAARSHSLSSSIAIPKPEVITVAVIPERSSSLQGSSAPSSKRHSLSGSSGKQSKRPSDGKPPSSWQRKRTMSESQSDRGRGENPKVVVPPRSSSLSAPTSRNTSRANSLTSDHFRRQRKEAETDLRRTLERMESHRLISDLPTFSKDTEADETPSKQPRQSASSSRPDPNLLQPTPGTSEWAALRPQSALATPFSQPSYQSASPELHDATAVNYFAHNNHSLQLIEPNITGESRAVREVRKHHYIKDDDGMSTQSPLRNPRQAPEPPSFQIVPPTPQGESQGDPFQQVRVSRRPSQRRSESFMQALTRGFSVRNPQNRKKGQHLDNTQHPFWRPQGFWDSFEEHEPKAEQERDMQVYNSLGMPQERTIITGPVSLVRRISQRRKENQARAQALAKQGSSSSLAKIRASHRLYKTSLLGVHMPFGGFADMRDRVLFAKQRKEDEKRERRRQDIRDKIGKEVVRQGDSRFLTSQDSVEAMRMMGR